MFDAFLLIYHRRTVDLLRLASGGSGVLREGALHPDLVNRLSREAAKAAGHVLKMCIRALDYCPPVDLTFGEYLRAIITADMDLMAEDEHGYRIAFIEAFRRRGIYPTGLRTLSEDSLRWARPEDDPGFAPGVIEMQLRQFVESVRLREHVDALRYKRDRREHWRAARDIRIKLHGAIKGYIEKFVVLQRLTGLALTDDVSLEGVRLNRDGAPVFTVQAVREASRIRDDGALYHQVFITLLQKQELEHEGQRHMIRCGGTLVFDLDNARVTCVIRKGVRDMERLKRTIKFKEGGAAGASLAATYFGQSREPFAALHSSGA